MPSPWHDTPNDLFKDDIAATAEIVRLAGVDLPAGTRLWLGPNVFNTRPAKEFIADTVILAGFPWQVTRAVVVETQKEPSEDKRVKLAMYAAALWLDHLCQVDVVVLCPDAKTASSFAAPIPTGMNGCSFQARVLRPGAVPAYTDPAEMAANPSLAVLSVAYHGRDPAVASAFVAGMSTLDGERAVQYYEYGYAMSPKETCRILEELMTTTNWPVYSPFAKLHYGKGLEKGTEQGIAQGERDAVVEVLRARGLAPTEDQISRINASTDLAQIKAWLRKSATATTVTELFD
jgi:hypothetical protein